MIRSEEVLKRIVNQSTSSCIDGFRLDGNSLAAKLLDVGLKIAFFELDVSSGRGFMLMFAI